jgi:hypothetical protein
MVTVTWQDANVRNEVNEVSVAEGHQRLGIPQDELWRKLGYTPEQIEAFKLTKLSDTQAQVAQVAAALRVDASRTGAQQGGQVQRNGAQGTNMQGAA